MRNLIIVTLFLSVTFIGCSRGIPVVPVTGVITLDGKPLEGATVAFLPADGTSPKEGSTRGASGGTDAAGLFTLRTFAASKAGAMQGQFIVTVSKIEVAAVVNGSPVLKELLPKVYTKQETSPFRAEVKRGKNHFEFDLKGTAAE